MWRLLTGRVLRREGHTVKKTVRRAALLALLWNMGKVMHTGVGD